MKIEIIKDGPYYISGGVPLVRKTQVVSEHGEPLTWKKETAIESDEEYSLCRCGQSAKDSPRRALRIRRFCYFSLCGSS